jgi:hypothetical protein
MKETLIALWNQFPEVRKHNLFFILWTLVAGTLLSSCFKEEVPIHRPLRGNLQVVQIPLTSKYNKQFFFDLFTGQIVNSNDNTIWDLAFDADDNGYHIWLNSSKLMQAYNTRSSEFSAITDDTGAEWTWDYPEGKPEYNAIGEWGRFDNGNVVSFRHVYIIDRGVTADNVKLGKRKVIFESLDKGTYRVRFAKLSGEDMHVIEVPKDKRFNRIYLSFDNGGQIVQVEPPKDSWDLLFTRYTHIFFEHDTLPYLVTGVLLNPAGVSAAKDSSTLFDNITINDLHMFTFQTEANTIGYNWKSFDIDDTKYSIIPNIFYIVKDIEGNYYKLRFIDFFSDSGERGFPKFEYQQL